MNKPELTAEQEFKCMVAMGDIVNAIVKYQMQREEVLYLAWMIADMDKGISDYEHNN